MSTKYIWICLFLLGMIQSGLSQNDCQQAVNLTGTSGNCDTYSFAGATFDVLNGDCAVPDDANNLWFTFKANGPDLNISTTHSNGADVAITLLRFTSGTCDPIKNIIEACTLNNLDINGTLQEGKTYFVALSVINNLDGHVELCFTQPDITPPPVNDSPCGAFTLPVDGSCVTGTTIDAEDEYPNYNCNGFEMQSVWYKFSMTDSTYFAAKISIENISLGGDIQVILGKYSQGCDQSFSFLYKYCGEPSGVVIDYNLLEYGEDYFINVASLASDEGDFKVCVEEFQLATNSDPCHAKEIVPNQACETPDTYFSLFEYDIDACDYSNHTLWYRFVPEQGIDDVRVNLHYVDGSENIFLGIGLFNGNWCGNSFEMLDSYCGNVAQSEIYLDSLELNRPYFILVGSTFGFTGKYSMCVDADYEDPFINGNACQAYELDNEVSCISGLNRTGNPTVVGTCDISTAIENWYKFETAQVGHEITIEYNDDSDQDVYVELGFYEAGCNDNFQVFYSHCGPTNGPIIQYNLPDSIDMAYVRVVSSAVDSVFFNICVNPKDNGYACFENDFCVQATPLGTVLNQSEICVEACSFGATKETQLNHYPRIYPTVWYSFESGWNVGSVQMTLSESSVFEGYVSVFKNCTDTAPVFTQFVQLGPNATFDFQTEVSTNYYIAFTPLSIKGGKMKMCLEGNTANSCQIQSSIFVKNTSLGSPVSGPFKSGEKLEVCFKVENYSPYSESSCQWLQGIVPSYSMGWDFSSFNFFGQPEVTQSVSPILNGVEWSWNNDVHAAIANPNRKVSDMNDDGLIDFCYTDIASCSGNTIAAGDLLPGGWYAVNGLQGGMHPDSTYGDGLHCDENNGAWEVCFNMYIPNQVTTNELKIAFHTIADGEIGDPSTSNNVCYEDKPVVKSFYIGCTSTPTTSQKTLQTCSELPLNIGEDSGIYSYHWTGYVTDSIMGITTGGANSAIMDLTNFSTSKQTVQYDLLTYQGSCLVDKSAVTVEVFPTPNIPSVGLTTICLDDGISMLDIIKFKDYLVEPYTIAWNSPNLEDKADAIWSEKTDESIQYTLTTTSGCVHQDVINIHVEDVQVPELIKPYTLCKNEVINMHTVIPLQDAINDNFTVDWGLDFIEDVPNAQTSFTESVTLPFTITGETGCVYSNAIDIVVPDIPINIIGDSIVCSKDEVSLSASFEYGGTFERYWILPNNEKIYFDGIVKPADVFQPGQNVFQFKVVTKEACAFIEEDTVFINQFPTLTFNQVEKDLGICPYDSVQLKTTVTPSYFVPQWRYGNKTYNEHSITVNQPGSYFVQAGSPGCVLRDTFSLEVYPAVNTSYTYDKTICVGDSSIINFNVPTYKFSWSTGSNSSQVRLPGGDYQVTVSNEYECFKSYDFTIVEQGIPSPTFTFDDNLCAGDSTWIVASTDTLNYLWSTGEQKASILSKGGAYTVFYNDDLGCQDSSKMEIEVTPYPTVDFAYEVKNDTVVLTADITDADSCYWVIFDKQIPYEDYLELVLPADSTYEVGLICNNGDCYSSKSDSINIPIITKLNYTYLEQFAIYPNPTNGRIMIENTRGLEIDYIDVVSMNGQRVRRKKVGSNQSIIPMELKAPNGVYIVQIFAGKEMYLSKLVKQ